MVKEYKKALIRDSRHLEVSERSWLVRSFDERMLNQSMSCRMKAQIIKCKDKFVKKSYRRLTVIMSR